MPTTATAPPTGNGQPLWALILTMRKARGWDQQTLADEAKVSKRSVCYLESPTADLTGRQLWTFGRVMEALCRTKTERVAYMDAALRAVGCQGLVPVRGA